MNFHLHHVRKICVIENIFYVRSANILDTFANLIDGDESQMEKKKKFSFMKGNY